MNPGIPLCYVQYTTLLKKSMVFDTCKTINQSYRYRFEKKIIYFKNSLPQGTDYSLVHYTISNFIAMISLNFN